MNRRLFLKSATIAAAGCALVNRSLPETPQSSTKSLFDGRTLNGWIQAQNSTTSFSGNDIADLTGIAKKLSDKSNALSIFLNDQFDDDAKASLAAAISGTGDAKQGRSVLAKNLNRIISAGSLVESSRFQAVVLRPETQQLLRQDLHGALLIHLNRMLLEDAFPSELLRNSLNGWTVKDGALASTGAGRGVLYTADDFSHFRLMFTMRHVSGNPDHQACVLIFCTRPEPDNVPLDALGGIQFQVPKGGHWDYRPGHNNAGGTEFTLITKPDYDAHQWSRIEILADASTGTARMAVAQPVGSRAAEILAFKDASAGKVGPIALQMHNAGLFDEYKDIVIDTNPKDELITIRSATT
ncbi:MAG TPA: DUF1080 domain-containing protein [Terriglobales bacterium]|nr:DUF1080 domain-containing protein [Terriglobales bacterium]